MKQSRKIDIRYIAGFFDGEGCITFSKIQKYNPMMKRRYPCTTIRMEASNTDFNIIKDIYLFRFEKFLYHSDMYKSLEKYKAVININKKKNIITDLIFIVEELCIISLLFY